MNVSERLKDIAALALEAGQPRLFKRLIHASVFAAEHDTDKELADALEQEEDAVDDEVVDEVVDDEVVDDEDVEAFAGFPSGALPHKERRRGPHPKDVGVAKPDWWNP